MSPDPREISNPSEAVRFHVIGYCSSAAAAEGAPAPQWAHMQTMGSLVTNQCTPGKQARATPVSHLTSVPSLILQK